MDPLSTLYEQLNSQAQRRGAAAPGLPEPPPLEDWLQYWNDHETEIGNLRHYEHWLRQRRG